MSPISVSGPVRCQRTGDAPTFRYHLKASSPSGAACVSLRSHSNSGHQPHARRLPPERSAHEHRPELPRSGPEAEISPVKPTWRHVARRFATINAPYRNLPGAQVPPAILRKSPRFRAARLTAQPAWRQLQFPEGLLWSCSIAEQKASQSLPALQVPVFEPELPSSSRWRPEAFFVVHWFVALPAVNCWVFSETRRSFRVNGRHPMPSSVPAIP